jgi:hypothetical protein
MSRSRLELDTTARLFLGMLALGMAALLAGAIFHFEPRAMTGVAIGCIPTGLFGAGAAVLGRRWMAARHPERLREERDACDERAAHIHRQASPLSFWVLYAYLFLYTILAPTRLMGAVGHTAVAVTSLCLASAVYVVALMVYRRKY